MTELLVLLSVFFLLTFLFVPITAGNARSTSATLCMANMRQLTVAWQFYASDNSERVVHNLHGGDAQGGAGASLRFSPWASGWEDWGTSPDNTNTLFLRDARWAKLAPYIKGQKNVHKCPADRYLSFGQRRKGWRERVRSVAMNGTLGHANYTRNPGPWDANTYAIALSLNDLIYPGPADTSLFLDEHPDSINDPFFFPPVRTWIDLPGNLHHGAGTFSFADGHAEFHTWAGKLRTARVTASSLSIPQGETDISWMSYHSNRVGERTY